MKLERFQEQIFFSTVRITIPRKSGIGASIGTGFILRTKLIDTKDRSVTLLLSTRHVYGDPSQPLILNFHSLKEDKTGPDLGKIVNIQQQEFSSVLRTHPNPEIDLACINISAITKPELNIYHKCLFPEMISNFSENELLPGKDVWFIGYPENRFDIAHNLPILRRGYIASMPKVDFNDKKQFIIDAHVFPGSSGSPVFTILENKFKLIGVVTETMIKNAQLQTIPTHTSLGFQQFLGLGIIIRADLIKELIDHVVKEISKEIEEEDGPMVEKE